MQLSSAESSFYLIHSVTASTRFHVTHSIAQSTTMNNTGRWPHVELRLTTTHAVYSWEYLKIIYYPCPCTLKLFLACACNSYATYNLKVKQYKPPIKGLIYPIVWHHNGATIATILATTSLKLCIYRDGLLAKCQLSAWYKLGKLFGTVKC